MADVYRSFAEGPQDSRPYVGMVTSVLDWARQDRDALIGTGRFRRAGIQRRTPAKWPKIDGKWSELPDEEWTVSPILSPRAIEDGGDFDGRGYN